MWTDHVFILNNDFLHDGAVPLLFRLLKFLDSVSRYSVTSALPVKKKETILLEWTRFYIMCQMQLQKAINSFG